LSCTHRYPLVYSKSEKQICSFYAVLHCQRDNSRVTQSSKSTVSIVQWKGNSVAHEVSDTENSRLNPSTLSRRKNAALVISFECAKLRQMYRGTYANVMVSILSGVLTVAILQPRRIWEGNGRSRPWMTWTPSFPFIPTLFDRCRIRHAKEQGLVFSHGQIDLCGDELMMDFQRRMRSNRTPRF